MRLVRCQREHDQVRIEPVDAVACLHHVVHHVMQWMEWMHQVMQCRVCVCVCMCACVYVCPRSFQCGAESGAGSGLHGCGRVGSNETFHVWVVARFVALPSDELHEFVLALTGDGSVGEDHL